MQTQTFTDKQDRGDERGRKGEKEMRTVSVVVAVKAPSASAAADDDAQRDWQIGGDGGGSNQQSAPFSLLALTL